MSGMVTHNLLKLTVWPSGTCQRCIVLGINGRNLRGCLWCCTLSYLLSSFSPLLPHTLELALLAAALALCEIANEKEWKVITDWGLITCTVYHSRQPH